MAQAKQETRPQLYTVQRVRVAPSVWVLAKYCLDNHITLITTQEMQTILAKRNLYTLYYDIDKGLELGLLRRVMWGLYEVNLDVAAKIATTMIPLKFKNHMVKVPDTVPQWREALQLAEAWTTLASDGTSPPGAVAGLASQVEAAAAALGGVIQEVLTPSGDRVRVLVRGNMYIILNHLNDKRSDHLYCIDYTPIPANSRFPVPPPGSGTAKAKLCSSDFDLLVRYMYPPGWIYSLSEALSFALQYHVPANSTAGEEGEAGEAAAGVVVGESPATVEDVVEGSEAEEAEGEEEEGEGPDAEGQGGSGKATASSSGRSANSCYNSVNSACGTASSASTTVNTGLGAGGQQQVVFVANVVLGGMGTTIRRVDPLAPPEDPRPALVFDNVRFARNGVVHQLHGLQPLSAVSAASAAGKLVYVEPGIQLFDNALYELSKLMDIHIYHSPGKDPRGTVRIEARPRARALKKLGLGRLLTAFMTYLHRLAGAFGAVVSAWFR
jgi:hypothetical protein